MVEIFFRKVAGFQSATLLKKGPYHGCFPLNFSGFFRTAFLLDTSRQLLLYTDILKEMFFRLQ